MKNIIVTGFPHSGTTILRKIIGNHPKVHDIGRECYQIDKKHLREAKQKNKGKQHPTTHIVIKGPWGSKVFQKLESYSDYKVVCILKNPLDVYASLAVRFKDEKMPQKYNFEHWEEFAKIFIQKSTSTMYKNIYFVLYHDMFDQNYFTLKKLFSWLDLTWKDKVVTDNCTRRIPINSYYIPTNKPSRQENEKFRSWQTNQAFQNHTNTIRNKLDPKLKIQIQESPMYRQLFLSPNRTSAVV